MPRKPKPDAPKSTALARTKPNTCAVHPGADLQEAQQTLSVRAAPLDLRTATIGELFRHSLFSGYGDVVYDGLHGVKNDLDVVWKAIHDSEPAVAGTIEQLGARIAVLAEMHRRLLRAAEAGFKPEGGP